ncbi:phthalate transporter [Xylogone sp. PMI_703]|nr:phthalate transporter [Xylogone sp. PMI_703]
MSSHDLEKPTAQVEYDHLESPTVSKASNDTRIVEFSPEEQRKIIRRIDYRLVIILGALYCASLTDRTNLGSASIAGMTTDLKPGIGNRYSIVNLIFFIRYIIFQPPAIVIFRKIGPRLFLSGITLFYGVTVIGFGFIHDWSVMIGLRVLLGVLEAGFFPGRAYLLSTWYPRYDLQKRFAVFYLIGTMASAFSGILAYGVMLAGWRWIFIVEGLVTCCLGVIGYIFIVDFPELSTRSWKFLNAREAMFVIARIEEDRHDTQIEPFHIGAYLRNALDLKVWAFAWLYMLATTNSYAIAFFLHIILQRGMGFDIAKGQCLVAPPYVAAALVMYTQAIYADRWRIRGPVIVMNACLGLVGIPLLGYTTNNGVRYFGVFLATVSANANVPAVLTYQANNIRGQWKRALLSRVPHYTIFRGADSPTYGPGILGTILSQALMIIIVGLLSLKFWRANKRAENGGKIIEDQKGFRYTL